MDMYNLMTEDEMFAMMEASSKKKLEPGEIDVESIFPSYTQSKIVDNTGAVKVVKTNLSQETSVCKLWDDFVKKEKAEKNPKPKTGIDDFGTVTVKSFAAKPDAKKLAGSIKALKKTDVKDLGGKITTTVEELGVGKVITKSNAASPAKTKLVGSIKPASTAKLTTGKKPTVNDVSGSTVTILKSMDAKLKSTADKAPHTANKGSLVGSIKPVKK